MTLTPVTSRSGTAVVFDSLLTVATATVDTGALAIPTGTLLTLLVYARSAAAQISDSVNVRFNGDAGANYDWLEARTDGGAVGDVNVTAIGATSGHLAYLPAGTTPSANAFCACTADIPGYSVTTGAWKTVLSHWGKIGDTIDSSANDVGNVTIAWHNTGAITQAAFSLSSGGNFVVGSRFTILVH